MDIHITRSHYRAYTINCFVFPKETNTGVGTHGNKATIGPVVNERVPSQNIVCVCVHTLCVHAQMMTFERNNF